jgi:CheY-like chemotaxis protein
MTRSSAAKLGKSAAPPDPPGAEHHPSMTLPPGTPLKKIPRPAGDTARSASPPGPAEERPATLEAILAEVLALRQMQVEMLDLLKSRPAMDTGAGPSASEDDELMAPLVPPVRTRRRKSALIMDDDAATRDAAVALLEQAEVPVRAVADGQKGVQAIAEEKPDIIVLELDIKGAMAGKDVINMIKATMEWVDIPILLYTRLRVESQKEARIAGADDVVLKSGGPAALVSRVITHFRRG